MKHLRAFFLQEDQQTFKKGAVILHQGETGGEVSYITDGFVKAYTIADDGDEKLISLLGPGDVMNLQAAFFSDTTHRYYYEAMTDGSLRSMPADQLEKQIEKNPAALFGLVRYVLTWNDELSQTLDNILQAKADIKLVNYLALLVERFGQEVRDGIVTLPFPLSHVQLASMVGTTRETMTVHVRQLSRKGVLKTNKSCFEINLEKLREMTDVE